MTKLLLLATFALCAGIAVPLAFPRWPLWMRATWRVGTLALLTFLVQWLVGSPLQPVLQDGPRWDRLWQQLVTV